jgi:hypothetical protein
MPANIMLPTKAKITALVCSGRRRPKVTGLLRRARRISIAKQAMKMPARQEDTRMVAEKSRGGRGRSSRSGENMRDF